MIKSSEKDLRFVSAVKGLRRAGYLADMGWLRLRRGWIDDPDELVPVYLRDPAGNIPNPKKDRI
jgi:hypothetical protein